MGAEQNYLEDRKANEEKQQKTNKSGRYKTKIASVSPDKNRHTFEKQNACFLGVSLQNKNFEHARFASMLEWVSRRFPTCDILIGDSIHRITLELRDNLTAAQAETTSLALGKQFLEENWTATQAYSGSSEFQFVTCNSIQQTADYAHYHTALTAYFEGVSPFRKSVISFARSYHSNSWNHLTPREREYRVQRSCDYFIEEFAIFACMVKRGNKVMLYPGSFSTLTEIADGLFSGICPELEALTIVSLLLKKR